MPEMTPGVIAPAAGGQVGSTAQPSGQPAGTQPAQPAAAQPGTGGQPAPGQQVQVPLSVVEAVRKELSEAKASKAEIEAKLNQIQAMQHIASPPAQPAQPAPVQSKDPFEGMEDEELINVKDLRKMVQTLQGTESINKVVEPLRADLAKIQLQTMDPNYEQTIRTYLPDMITVNPMLREMIIRAPNPLVAALGVARMSPKFIQSQESARGGQPPAPPPDILSDLQKIIENATRPAAPGSMGGGGAISGNDRYRSMSDADFDAEVNRVLQGQAR